jgi:hypothetical protein
MRKTTNFKRYERGGAVLAEPLAATVDVTQNDNPNDDASEAFKRQIEALKESERIQQERAAAAQAPALTKKEMQFLKDNPDFLDDHEIAHQALMRAHRGGHVLDSDEFHSAVKEHWQALRMPPARTSPASYDAPDLPDLPEASERTRNVSAPVSRETQANGGFNKYGDRPGRITLSVQQKEAAKFSGLTEREYAEQLLRLREEQKNGNYGGSP